MQATISKPVVIYMFFIIVLCFFSKPMKNRTTQKNLSHSITINVLPKMQTRAIKPHSLLPRLTSTNLCALCGGAIQPSLFLTPKCRAN